MDASARLTIGQVAKRAGLTVRTLHHYDDVGLVRPSDRSDAGYRLYGPDALRRLEKVLVLRQLGFSLEQISTVLDDPAWTRTRVLRTRLAALDREIEDQRRVRDRLAELIATVEGLGDAADLPGGAADGDVLDAVAAMDRVRSYFTAEQLDAMARRSDHIGEDVIQHAQNRWPELIAEVAEHVRRGTPAADPRVVALAQEWRGLVAAFSGGDPEVEANLGRMYRAQPEMARAMGISEEMTELIRAALEA